MNNRTLTSVALVIGILCLLVAIWGYSWNSGNSTSVECSGETNTGKAASCCGDYSPQNSNESVGNHAVNEPGEDSKVEVNTATDQTNDSPETVQRASSYIQFDYEELPSDVNGRVRVYMVTENGPVVRFDSSLSDRPENTGRLPEGRYGVVIVGDAAWFSDWFKLGESETRTIALKATGTQAVAATVVDAETGVPIVGASLTISGKETPGSQPAPIPNVLALSDEAGAVVLRGQPVAALTYRVQKYGYVHQDRLANSIAGGECHLGIVPLERAIGTISVEFDFAHVKNFSSVKIELDDPYDYSTTRFETRNDVRRTNFGDPLFEDANGAVTFVNLEQDKRYILHVRVVLERNPRPDEIDPYDESESKKVYVGKGDLIDNFVYPGATIKVNKSDLDWKLKE